MLGHRLRLLHPYPSLLNGFAVLAMALVAGATILVATRLALAMTLLQFAIGSINDVADAPHDAGHVPPKPIPSGFVSRRAALGVGIAAGLLGLGLTLPSGFPVVAVAGAGLACGLAYDAGLSRTAVSWVPLAVALPLVPAYAWLGATGELPSAVLAILPIGAFAGGGLAVGNALVDIETDREAGRKTIAVVLGQALTWRIQAGLLVLSVVLAVLFMPAAHPVARLVAGIGAGLVAVGGMSLLGDPGPRRRLGWQVEAAGIACLGIGWVVASAGPL